MAARYVTQATVKAKQKTKQRVEESNGMMHTLDGKIEQENKEVIKELPNSLFMLLRQHGKHKGERVLN